VTQAHWECYIMHADPRKVQRIAENRSAHGDMLSYQATPVGCASDVLSVGRFQDVMPVEMGLAMGLVMVKTQRFARNPAARNRAAQHRAARP